MEYDALPVAELVETRPFWNLRRALILSLTMSLLVGSVVFASQNCTRKTPLAEDVRDPVRPSMEYSTPEDASDQFTLAHHDPAGTYESTEMNGLSPRDHVPGPQKGHHGHNHHHHPSSSKRHHHGDPDVSQDPPQQSTKSIGNKVKGQRAKPPPPHPKETTNNDKVGKSKEKHHPRPSNKSKKSSKENKHSPSAKKSSQSDSSESSSQSDSSDSSSESLDD